MKVEYYVYFEGQGKRARFCWLLDGPNQPGLYVTKDNANWVVLRGRERIDKDTRSRIDESK